MAPFWIMAAIWIATTILQKLFTPRPKSPEQEFKVPTAEEGRPIPVWWGTVEVAPNTVWFGGVLKRKVSQNWRYYANMQHVFGFGVVNEIIDISWDEKSARNQPIQHPTFSQAHVPTPDVIPGSAPLVNAGSPMLIDVHGDSGASSDESASMFGGNQQGGGVAGDCMIYWGTDGQAVDVLLSSAAAYGAAFVSRWPRLCYMRWGKADGTAPFYLGANSSTPVPFKIFARRTAWWETVLSPLGQDETDATIGYDANPAEMLYDAITSHVYGLGRDPSRLDLASFIACAASLKAEVITPTKTGFGLSALVATPVRGSDFVRQVCDHIDAVLATNPVTGLLRMKLIRGDYDPLTIPVIDPSNSRELDYSPTSWGETINEVRITFPRLVDTDERRGFVEGLVSAHDEANFAATGAHRTKTVNMPFVTHQDIAQLIADRTLRALGQIAKVKWKMFRDGYGLMQGDVVTIDPLLLDPYGVTEALIVRITAINYGTLTDSYVEVEGVEDIFTIAEAVAPPPDDSGWEEPDDDTGDEGSGPAGPGSGGGFT